MAGDEGAFLANEQATQQRWTQLLADPSAPGSRHPSSNSPRQHPPHRRLGHFKPHRTASRPAHRTLSPARSQPRDAPPYQASDDAPSQTLHTRAVRVPEDPPKHPLQRSSHHLSLQAQEDPPLAQQASEDPPLAQQASEDPPPAQQASEDPPPAHQASEQSLPPASREPSAQAATIHPPNPAQSVATAQRTARLPEVNAPALPLSVHIHPSWSQPAPAWPRTGPALMAAVVPSSCTDLHYDENEWTWLYAHVLAHWRPYLVAAISWTATLYIAVCCPLALLWLKRALIILVAPVLSILRQPNRMACVDHPFVTCQRSFPMAPNAPLWHCPPTITPTNNWTTHYTYDIAGLDTIAADMRDLLNHDPPFRFQLHLTNAFEAIHHVQSLHRHRSAFRRELFSNANLTAHHLTRAVADWCQSTWPCALIFPRRLINRLDSTLQDYCQRENHLLSASRLSMDPSSIDSVDQVTFELDWALFWASLYGQPPAFPPLYDIQHWMHSVALLSTDPLELSPNETCPLAAELQASFHALVSSTTSNLVVKEWTVEVLLRLEMLAALVDAEAHATDAASA